MLDNTIALDVDSHNLYTRTPAGLWASVPRSIRDAGYSMTEQATWGVDPPISHRSYPLALSMLTTWQRVWVRWLDRLVTMHREHAALDLKTMALTYGGPALRALAVEDAAYRADLDSLHLTY